MPKIRENWSFLTQNQPLFFKSVHYVFINLYLSTGINVWLKMTALNFWRKFVLSSKNQVLQPVACSY